MANVGAIPEYYSGRTVLVTGGTGFMGQALVEKILRSCPNIAKIIIIIRENRKGNFTERYNRFLDLEVFNRLRKENPLFHKKICPFKGNLEEPKFGLSPDCYQVLTENVSIVFHAAAMIKLDPPLREAILANVLPMRNMITFANECRTLDAFVHVSTFYSNIELEHVGEEIYPTAYSAQQLLDMCSTMKCEKLQKKKRDILGKSRNTYTFTKKITESMLAEISNSIPVALIRPALISPALNEPYPGWTFGYSTFNGILKNIEAGIFRFITGDDNFVSELVPVDLVVNNTIASAWYIWPNSTSGQSIPRPLVFNFISSTVNVLFLKDFAQYVNAYHAEEGDSSKHVTVIGSRVKLVLRCLCHGLMLDITSFAKCSCPSTSNLKIQMFVLHLMELYEHLVQLAPSKTFHNTDVLEASLGKEDSCIFPMDMRKIDWESYLTTSCREIALAQYRKVHSAKL